MIMFNDAIVIIVVDTDNNNDDVNYQYTTELYIICYIVNFFDKFSILNYIFYI